MASNDPGRDSAGYSNDSWTSSSKEEHSSKGSCFSEESRQDPRCHGDSRMSGNVEDPKSFEDTSKNIDSSTTLASSRSTNPSSGISWEDWLLRKEFDRRAKITAQDFAAKPDSSKSKNSQEIRDSVKRWLYKKSQVKKAEEQRKKEQELKKLHLEEERRKKGSAIFSQWMEKKDRNLKVAGFQKIQKKKEEIKSQKTRQEMAKQAYADWLKKRKKGYTLGEVKAYIKGSLVKLEGLKGTPAPAYVNPIPWQSPQENTPYEQLMTEMKKLEIHPKKVRFKF